MSEIEGGGRTPLSGTGADSLASAQAPPVAGAGDGAGATASAGPPAEGGSRKRIDWIGLLRRLTEANAAVVTILAIVSALIVGAILILVTTPAVLRAWGAFASAPGAAFSITGHTIGNAYSALFTGSIFDPTAFGNAISSGQGWTTVFTPLSETLVSATPLILAGTGVALGFSTGVFNIGAQGQLIAGALGALYVGFAVHLPIGIHLPLVILGGAAGGAIAGFIPGYLKARTGAHEVITTIMLNYIFLYLLAYLLTVAPFQQPGQSNAISKMIPSTAQMPHLFGSGLRVNLGLVVALAVVVLAAWFTTQEQAGLLLQGHRPEPGRRPDGRHGRPPGDNPRPHDLGSPRRSRRHGDVVGDRLLPLHRLRGQHRL